MNSKYKILLPRPLPAGLLGESYVVIAASQTDAGDLLGEFYILTQRPHEAMHREFHPIATAGIPAELGKLDLEFAIQDTELLAREQFSQLVEDRVAKLMRHDVHYGDSDSWKEIARPLVGCWMRGRFREQIFEMSRTTRCEGLSRYLSLVRRIGA